MSSVRCSTYVIASIKQMIFSENLTLVFWDPPIVLLGFCGLQNTHDHCRRLFSLKIVQIYYLHCVDT